MSSTTHVYTSSRPVGFGEDLSDAGDAAKIGVLLLAAGIGMLVWNEGNAFRRFSALREGVRRVVSMVSGFVNADLEGRLVHTKGGLVAAEGVKDDFFGIHLPNTLKLTRRVLMYQWVEHQREETRVGNGEKTRETTFTYQREWKGSVVDSKGFRHEYGHENPREMRFLDLDDTADPIELGAFCLSPVVIEKIDWLEACNDHSAQTIPDPRLREEAQWMPSGFYFGRSNPRDPRIGDHKVVFQVAPEKTVSLVAQQTGRTFAAYQGRHRGEVLFLQQGEKEALEMFQDARADLALRTTMFRILGVVLLVVGLACSSRWIATVLFYVPLLGRHLSAGAEFLLFVIALVLGVLVGGTTIVLSWILQRCCILCCEGDCSLKDCKELSSSLEDLHRANSKRFLGYEAVPPVEIADHKISAEILSQDPVLPSAYQNV